jgi:hypothetical protein
MEAAMGFLDNVLDKSLPQGSGLAKPLMAEALGQPDFRSPGVQD